MAQFAKRLGPYFKTPVLDMTGLSGAFDFRENYSSVEPEADVTASIIACIEQLGLQLEKAKGAVETIAIDRTERLKNN